MSNTEKRHKPFQATYDREEGKFSLSCLYGNDPTNLDAHTYDLIEDADLEWDAKEEAFVAYGWTWERERICEAIAGWVDRVGWVGEDVPPAFEL